MRIYICYSRDEYELARTIYGELREEGVSVFLDRNSIPAGTEWERQIEKEIPSSDAVILIWSRRAAKSPWVMRELTTALMSKCKIIPLLTDEQPLSPLVDFIQGLRWDNTPLAREQLKVALGFDPSDSQSDSALPLLEAIQNYREVVLHHYQSLRILGTENDLPIEKIYLPLCLVGTGQQLVSEKFTAEDLITLGIQRTLVLGRPGTGKTTLLKYLAFRACSDSSSLFPVLIRIADLMSTNDSLITFVTQHIKGLVGKRIGDIISSWDNYCRSGTLLLLDGLDEIKEVDQTEFLKRLSSFRTEHPDCRLVIASRYSGFNDNMYEDFSLFKIQELNEIDIEKYIWAVCQPEYREKVWNTVKGDSRLFELAKTPFLLAMMCAAPGSLGTRATQRATLFKSCTDYLLKVRDWQEQGPGRPRENPGTSEVLENALKTLAVRFFKLDIQDNFSEEEILYVIRQMPGTATTLRPPEILEKICSYSGLLQRAGASFYFIHRSIWEFFVAVGMRNEPLENLLARANSPKWEEPIRLFVGLTPERDLPVVLKGLWEQNKALTLRSMMELTIFPDQSLLELAGRLGREDRLRLMFQLEENLEHTSSDLDRVRMLIDTISALIRVEKDCEVIYNCVRLLDWHNLHCDAPECADLVVKILDLSNADKRRQFYCDSDEFRFSFVHVAGGSFTMGTESEDRTPDEKPEHSVFLDPYWIGRFEVTNRMYYDDFPYSVDRRDVRSTLESQPIIRVTWYEAMIFAKWLNCDLPTEAEWEYACRSRAVDDNILYDYQKIPAYAWYIENSNNQTHDVGTKKPNSLGLFDMLGNVREWCKDWFEANYYQQCLDQGEVRNPEGPTKGIQKAIRGGCFDWNIANLVPTYRNYNTPDNIYYANGFRLVYRGADVLKGGLQ